MLAFSAKPVPQLSKDTKMSRNPSKFAVSALQGTLPVKIVPGSIVT